MKTASLGIWTQIPEFISEDDNHYTTSIIYKYICIVYSINKYTFNNFNKMKNIRMSCIQNDKKNCSALKHCCQTNQYLAVQK